MPFYKEIFGGELHMSTVGESPMAAQMPTMKDNIMHAVLNNKDVMLMGSDMMLMEDALESGNRISLCLICKDKEEIETLFAKLSAGGKVTQALITEYFGMFGSVTDKFGINWMFQADIPKA